jgi:DNA-binding NarL/FixJ family response regulator
MKKIRVLIVDSEPIVRAGLRAILCEPEFIVVGEAENDTEALLKAAKLEPDVIITEVSKPGGSIETVTRIRETIPKAKVHIFTRSDDANDFYEALGTGARGYQTKLASPAELIVALKKVASGLTVLLKPAPTKAT